MPSTFRRFTTLAFALSALAWATPCSVLQAELSWAVPEASDHAHHHAAAAGTGAAAPASAQSPDDPHAHHAHHAAEAPSEPPAEWRPACPCGCGQLPQPGPSLGGVGFALLPAAASVAADPAAERVSEAVASERAADPLSIDHVPIPS